MAKKLIKKIVLAGLISGLCSFAFADTYYGSNDILLGITNDSPVPLILYGETLRIDDESGGNAGGMELVPSPGYAAVNDCYSTSWDGPIGAPAGTLETFSPNEPNNPNNPTARAPNNIIMPGQTAVVHTCSFATNHNQGQGWYEVWGLNGSTIYMETGDVSGSQFNTTIAGLPQVLPGTGTTPGGDCGSFVFVQAPSASVGEVNNNIPCPSGSGSINGKGYIGSPVQTGNICAQAEKPQNTSGNWGCWIPIDVIVGGSDVTTYRNAPTAP